MSSEQNYTEVELHQGPPPASVGGSAMPEAGQSAQHGMGQSKSSRRRRRKRKNKAGGVESGAQPTSGQSAVEIQASAAFVPQPQQQGGAHQQQNGAGQTTRRWKKKFRDRPRTGDNAGSQGGGQQSYRSRERNFDTHQPGNTVSGFGRKNKQRDRGPRGFVGPMDHSYRGANGNLADGPPSTIESHGGYQSRGGRSYVSDSQPIDYSLGRAIPIPEDAPTKIFFFIDDLFFNAKITETARKLGVKVAFVKNDKDVVATLTGQTVEAERPSLIVFDLNNAGAKPLSLIPKLKTKLKRSTSIIGFLSHLQSDLKAKAVEAGCDTVMPRAAFSQNLPNLLRRYGTHQEEEENFNQ